MPPPDLLLLRLNEIASALQHSGHGLALIGLGSVGQELDRLDEYSDLDFFAIVEDGYKRRYIDELDWLAQVHPLAYNFQNSPDGHKLLFADGVFCEFAVFELAELPGIAFAPGRVVWQRQDAPDNLALPGRPPPAASQHSTEWLLGEALTNLYVGMGRYLRGEKLSAQRFIQHYAVDRDFAVVTSEQISRPLRLEALGEWQVQLWVPKNLYKDKRQAWNALRDGGLLLALPVPELPWTRPAPLDEIEPALVCTNFMEARRALEEQGFATLLPDFLSPPGPAGTSVRLRWPELDSLQCHYRLAWNPLLLRLNLHAVKEKDVLMAELRARVKRLVRANENSANPDTPPG